MTTDLGSHERQFTGRGGAGNFVIKNPIPTENLPKQYSAKPVGGNATGRGGAGNFYTSSQVQQLPEAPKSPPVVEKPPLAYKGGRGGAGNIEAVSLNEKKKENREQYELGQVQTNLNDSNAMPREPTERPILRVD